MISLPQSYLLLAAGSLLLSDRRRRHIALIGVVAVALALASFDARNRVIAQAGGLGLAPEGLSFLRINLGLLLLGLALPLGAAARDASTARVNRSWSLMGALLVLAASALLIRREWTGLMLAPWRSALGAALLLAAGAIGVSLLVGVLRFGPAIVWLDDRVLSRSPAAAPMLLDWGREVASWAALSFSAAIIIWAPQLYLVIGGAVLAAIAAHLLWRARGRGTPIPLLPLAMLPLLVFAHRMATIAGPVGLSLPALQTGPFSPAAQAWLLPLLLLPVWAWCGFWPLHGIVPAGVGRVVGGLLLWRLGVQLLPDGVAHWQVLAEAVIVLGIWHAASTRRVSAGLLALAMFGLMSRPPEGPRGGLWLLGFTALLPFTRFWEPLLPPLPIRLVRLAWLLPAWALLLVLRGGLSSQVLLTTLLAAGTAALLWSTRLTAREE